MVPLVMLLLPGSYLFGWAKPVPVNYAHSASPEERHAWVAAAGPGANLFMATGWALLFRLGQLGTGSPIAWRQPTWALSASHQISLFVLNLLPLPPLDGGRVVRPAAARASPGFARIEPCGLVILLALLFTETLVRIIWPVLSFLLTFCRCCRHRRQRL